jgi:hypothetical protein
VILSNDEHSRSIVFGQVKILAGHCIKVYIPQYFRLNMKVFPILVDYFSR